MPTKRRIERLIGTIKAVDVVQQPRGMKHVGEPVALRIRTRIGSATSDDWYAVARQLKPRVRDLAEVSDELVGHTFEFALSDSGEVVSLTRISS